MALKASELVRSMVAAARGQLDERWPELREYAEAEAKKLAQTLLMIEKLKLRGKINKRQAELLLDIQRNTSRSVILTIEGLGLLAAEAAINAALDSITDTVNGAIGWRLL